MAVSYVLISAVAAFLAAMIGWFVVPRGLSPWISVEYAKDWSRPPQDQAEVLAAGDAMGIGLAAADLAERDGGLSDRELLVRVAERWAGPAGAAREHDGLTMVRGVVGTDGRLVWPSVPPVSGAGSTPPGFPGGTAARGGMGTRPGQPVAWATSPIQADGRVIGVVYVWARDSPAAHGPAPSPPVITSGWKANGTGWLGTAVLALLLLVPVCAGFGLLSTRKLVSRVARLSRRTAAMAEGDLGSRVPVSGADEVGRLEESFNTMSERVEAAVRAEREAAAAQALLVERARMARELHDSVSQDLFSLSLVAGTLRRTLPPESRARAQAATMEQTIGRTMREMRAMLLELRPAELAEAGLVPALRELCRTYEVRLGMTVTADLAEVELDPKTEHTLLRVVQEALGNAARHGGAQTAELRLAASNGGVEVLVRDQGRGFDPESVAERHGLGLRLMRERITEIGGTIQVASAPGAGTTVHVRVPRTPGGTA
ncbi:HAMP domain-containing sensor histidine kinase [Acrocarpospora catenulata]|uniref:HAMP domain-containing sensor histidine kinase n=1 Tax=Acrocarpospora catenulata TaxID=2836182 RepID=UPI001BD9A603|nr:ATP-binding protein [Acrocarpospora catenulata]